jgi:predicted nucleotidyltransferase
MARGSWRRRAATPVRPNLSASSGSSRASECGIVRRFRIRRLEVFGSAARGADFDARNSDADFLVRFDPDVKPDISSFLNVQEAFEQALGRPVTWLIGKLSNRVAITSGVAGYCRRQSQSMWRDETLVLDMLLAAGDAVAFIAALDQARFTRSKLHQKSVIRSLEVIGEAAAKVFSTVPQSYIPRSPGARSSACGIA